MLACDFEGCNQGNGHAGPHGHTIGGGVILAPRGGGEGQVGPSEPSPVSCDCCGSDMIARRFENGGGLLKCTVCEQDVIFNHDGSSSRAILAIMYPSKMSERSKIFQEFLDHRIFEFTWNNTARHFFGLCSKEQRDDAILKILGIVNDKRLEIKSMRRSWKNWFGLNMFIFR